MNDRKLFTTQNIMILGILAIAIIYALIIKPNYYVFNGKKLYLELLKAESFVGKDSYEIISKKNALYYCGKNGFRKTDNKGNNIWDKAYYIDNPKLIVAGDYMAVVDIGGTLAYTFDDEGLRVSAKAISPIVMADLSKEGVLLIVQEKEAGHLIQIFDKNGVLKVERGTIIKTDGYPVGVSLSDSGNRLATSYLSVEGGVVKTSLTIFGFGKEESKKAENILGAFIIDNEIVPEIKFLDEKALAAIGEKSISFYEIKEKPILINRVELKNKINNLEFFGEKIIVQYGEMLKAEKENFKDYIEIFSKDGKKMESYKGPEKVKDIIADGNNYFLITPKTICYQRDNKKIWETEINKEAKEITRLKGGKYIITFENGYEIFKIKDI